MQLRCKAILLIGVLVAALSGSAQARLNSGANPITHGHGAYVEDDDGHIKWFTLSVVELPSGPVQGHGMFIDHVSRSFIHFELSSYMFVGDSLGVAGEINMAHNAPPQLAVGRTIFFFLK